jgi:hypothetical protein
LVVERQGGQRQAVPQGFLGQPPPVQQQHKQGSPTPLTPQKETPEQRQGMEEEQTQHEQQSVPGTRQDPGGRQEPYHGEQRQGEQRQEEEEQQQRRQQPQLQDPAAPEGCAVALLNRPSGEAPNARSSQRLATGSCSAARQASSDPLMARLYAVSQSYLSSSEDDFYF